MSKDNGGPAFPTQRLTIAGDIVPDEEGMTLRDYFAAKAMQSLCQGAVLPPDYDASEDLAIVAFRSYEVADAMLMAREE